MEHIVLLGDSIFDNKVYVDEAPDVVSHLRNMLPGDWKATLCAVDGSTISGIKGQIRNVPKDASCLFVSVGGNDEYQSTLRHSSAWILTADEVGKDC